MISPDTIARVAAYFAAHREEWLRDLLKTQAEERERLGCARLREMLHARGREKRMARSGFNAYRAVDIAKWARVTRREAA